MKVGFCSLYGLANAGKSTILNAILKTKIEAVSEKPQTTRENIQGIYNDEDSQIVFVDTPGLHDPHKKLGQLMLQEAKSALYDVDAIIYVIDASKRVDKKTANRLATLDTPIILAFNKIDLIKFEQGQEKIKEYKEIEKIDSKYVITTLFHNKIVSDVLDENYIKIATEHNYHNNNKQYINKVITSCRNSDYLVCVSNELKDFYKGKLKNFKTKVVYIPNVIDKLPIIKKEHNKNTLIAVGRLAREKGFGDLIDIVNIIKNDIPNIKVNIVGDGYEKDELENKIINLNLEKNIFLLGKKTFEEVENLMQESYIYLMTSYTESFGLVLIEAMSNKICCIGFDTSAGAREILKDGNGILIENRDKSLFAQKVVELINDDKKYNLICNNAYKYCKIYLASNVKNSWLELLECKNEKIF